MLSLYIAIYSAYVSVVLVWCILGAILNPEKFLPMASGAIVFVGFVAMIYARLKKVHEMLENAVGEGVDQQMQTALTDTIEKEKQRLEDLANKPIDSFVKTQFHKAVNSYMIKNGFPGIEEESMNAVLDGDMGALVGVLNKNCGIHSCVGLGLVGLLKKDNTLIMDAIDKLAIELDLDRNITGIIAEVALDSYNPDSIGINKAQGTIILSLKKLFRKAFPQFPLETLDGLLQVVSEGDPRPLESILMKLQIPPALFKLAIAFVMKDEPKIQSSIRNLSKEVLPVYYAELFEALYIIFKGNPKAGLKSLAEILGFEHTFLIEFVIAVIKQDNSLIRLALSNSVDQISNSLQKKGLYIKSKNQKELKGYLLAIYSLTRGSNFNMVSLVKESVPGIDPTVADIFYKASNGSMRKFDSVLDSLGLATQKKAILELSGLLLEREVPLEEIGGKLGVDPENTNILRALISLTIASSKYFLRVRPKIQLEKKNSTLNGSKDSQAIDTMMEITETIKKNLYILYNNEVLKIDAAVKRNQFLKIASVVTDVFQENSGQGDLEQTESKTINPQNRREVLMAEAATKIKEILKGDQQVIQDIIEKGFEYLDFGTEKKNYFKSMCLVVTAFILDTPLSSLDTATDQQLAMKRLSIMLDTDEEYLELFLDIFSGNPYRIFKCLTPHPKVDFQTNEIFASFNTSRLATIADILNCARSDVRKYAGIWINSHDLVNKGEQFISKLAKERLGIDPMFFLFLVMRYQKGYKHSFGQVHSNLNMSVRKFVSNQLKKVQRNIENDIRPEPFFFESLRTEEVFDHGTEEAPGLDDLSSDHEIYDNPIGLANGRTKEDVISFIKIMDNMVKIKEGEPETFEKLFKVDAKLGRLISVVYKSISNKDLESYIGVLLNLSKTVKIKLEVGFNVADAVTDIYDKVKTLEFLNLQKTFNKQDESQSNFFQFILLFTCNKLNNILIDTASPANSKKAKKMRDLFLTLNKFLPVSQKLVTTSLQNDEIFPMLFEAGFFMNISKHYFHTLSPFLRAIPNPECITGVIAGLSLQNKNLIRNSLTSLVGKQVKTKYLNGVIGFIVNDPAQEKDMRAVTKKINLNSDLAINLVELNTDSTNRDKYNAALSICKKYCTASRRVSALMAMFKRDLSNIHIICEKLEIDTEIMSAMLA